MQEILSDEIDDLEFHKFSIENFSEMMGYIAIGNLSIRIQRILLACPTVCLASEMRFGVGKVERKTPYSK